MKGEAHLLSADPFLCTVYDADPTPHISVLKNSIGLTLTKSGKTGKHRLWVSYGM